MDAQVNEMLSRSTDNKGTERAVQIRKQQEKERAKLQKDIETGNAAIAKLNEERAPIAKDLRKVEAEVGPIKYIAALIYGDNPDSNILEKAVRWVIITIVAVFDPLAVILLLASQYSFAWFRQDREATEGDSPKGPEPTVTPIDPIVPDPVVEEEKPIPEEPVTIVEQPVVVAEPIEQPAEVVEPVINVIKDTELNLSAKLAKSPNLEDIKMPALDMEYKSLDIRVKDKPPVEVVIEDTETDLDRWNKMIQAAEAEVEAAKQDAEKFQPTEESASDPEYDDAAAEAAKWAEEQREKAEDAKKKDSITWMERQGSDQIKRTL
jgi:hypothetical protein